MEAFPPFTVVNGKVWPVLDVQPASYRFRVLNGSNARTYRLALVHDGEPALDRIAQIGTDHGLLRAPAAVPPDGLVLASAERADLLVARPGRQARPHHRPQRARTQGHHPGEPERDRRDRRLLHHLQRPVHVPLPHPRTRGSRHDAALRDDAPGAHALHGLTVRA
jgi:FtsP/CotA-like multicopper oxidase with cupredoxin domain